MGDMSGRWSSSQRSSVRGMQIRPRPFLAMKLMASGVIFSAALADFFDGFFDGGEHFRVLSHGKRIEVMR